MSQSKPKTARPRGERPVQATESPRTRQILDDRTRRLAAPEAGAADVTLTAGLRNNADTGPGQDSRVVCTKMH